ncbi:hypothetical protein [Virgibacillus oceani]|uniref:Uncharacterized protein n=1 Tax=Virgibacillus oceani TaxID=1479511 RepID=A0A917HRF0_9BACI|nr:hypothetical protein [Virgibacillus oceani]GGG86669.1 hypothetical protein GCM10011398_35640 [Virgibacillus oceani]
MKKGLKIGLFVGIIAGVAGILLNILIGASTGLNFEQINPVSILIASIVSNLIGAIIFIKWLQKTGRPALNYIMLTAVVTILLTLMDTISPPAPKFWIMAYPLHLVVALFSIFLIPRWLGDKRESTTQAVSG